MAKRNKNREASRPFTGGVRKTANYREVSRSVTRDVTAPYEFVKPDLSAFETINETANARISFDAPAARPAARGVSSSPRTISATTPSKRSLERKTETVHKIGTARPRVSDYKPALLRPNKSPPAKKLERHEVRPARLEPLRVTCKPRPKDTRPKSGGSGKEFVPWCDRRS